MSKVIEKKYNPQGDVEAFMTACDQDAKRIPSMPSRDILLLRARLLLEEVIEFIEGAGCSLALDIHNSSKLMVISDATKEPDLQEMYDAIVDINYVSYGAACALGVSVEEGHEEVHRSNMTKIGKDGKVVKDEFGKVIKPSTYEKPNLKMVLEKQGYKK